MGIFTWQKSYEVAHSQVDDDHRQLFATIDELFEVMTTGEDPTVVYRHLGTVHQYVAHHFAREEQMMVETGYPGLHHHQKSHADFMLQYVGFMDRDPKVLIVKVSVFLHDWFRTHILKEDRAFFEWMQQKTLAG